DRLVGLTMLVALSPVMLAVAAAVAVTSPGPILFRQKRYGFNNELIEVYKFRSMFVDQGDATAAKLVTRGDPRVTPVGRFIRRTSLDELPQLFNVIKGELSLVGPRPHALQAKAANTLYDLVGTPREADGGDARPEGTRQDPRRSPRQRLLPHGGSATGPRREGDRA
ncbi:sugar transferase, partial [Methylobacterium sp. J-090]|uniref:sugar transferase n=1 Tax=Methylobacterium sp. J-090 TaxID=2836666 RepID=UPI003918EF23